MGFVFWRSPTGDSTNCYYRVDAGCHDEPDLEGCCERGANPTTKLHHQDKLPGGFHIASGVSLDLLSSFVRLVLISTISDLIRKIRADFDVIPSVAEESRSTSRRFDASV